jgi:hypothetical protein
MHWTCICVLRCIRLHGPCSTSKYMHYFLQTWALQQVVGTGLGCGFYLALMRCCLLIMAAQRTMSNPSHGLPLLLSTPRRMLYTRCLPPASVSKHTMPGLLAGFSSPPRVRSLFLSGGGLLLLLLLALRAVPCCCCCCCCSLPMKGKRRAASCCGLSCWLLLLIEAPGDEPGSWICSHASGA